MNQSALAKALGMTRQAVSKLKAQGMPVTSVKAAQAWREKRQNLAARKPLPKGAPPVDTDRSGSARDTARAAREAYQARLARLEFERRSAKLVDADRVKVQVFQAARAACANLLTIPDRLAPVIARTADVTEVHRLMLEEIERTCQRIAGEAATIR